VPLVKNENSSDTSNYRPVSLTSGVCNAMKRIVKDSIVDNLNEYNVI